MSRRIWMLTLKSCNYAPLRYALGLISREEFDAQSTYAYKELVPKYYTTRSHKLTFGGIYHVVEGSRYKAKPVEPRIEFRVSKIYPFDIKNMLIYGWETLKSGTVWGGTNILDKDGYTFPELDLGIRYKTLEDLKNVLLKLNPKATENTMFYIHRIESVDKI